jgi:4-diphosphocytidyl-2-C-methyl-D-erythritol kinase
MNLHRTLHQRLLVLLLAVHSWICAVTSFSPLSAVVGSQGSRQQRRHQRGWSVGSSIKATAIPESTATDASSEASSTASLSASNGDDDPNNALSLFSPCKINLFLRILRKRDDGYHDLASLFQAVGFGDTLELALLTTAAGDEDGDGNQKDNSRADSARSCDVFTCNMEGVPTDSRNLVMRALELMRARTGIPRYFRANLVKQVPAQAGLGGGSANAATAMWGANELLGRPATLEQVSEVDFYYSLG